MKTYRNFGTDSAKGKFIDINAYNKKTYLSNNLMMSLNLLGKQEQAKPQRSRWKEIILISA
jgi:hypothetical protein